MEPPITRHEQAVLEAIDQFLATKPPRFPRTGDLVEATGLSEAEVTDAVRSLERLDCIVIGLPELGGEGEVTHITKTGLLHL